MCNLLTQIPKEEFKKNVPISFNDINYGFTNFKSLNLTHNLTSSQGDIENLFIKFFIKLYNISETCYVDFFLCNLSDEEIINLKTLLSNEDNEILTSLLSNTKYTSPYFKINDERIIPFLVRLSTREIFFTTFYFPHITIWGNYNLKFPLFYLEGSIINKISTLCNELNLIII
ncbi:MAG: hypothetical protein ACRC2K_14225 [Clostridium sp.]